MGYLRQKKSEERVDIMLKLLFAALLVFLIAGFYGNGEGMYHYLNAFRFHYYIIATILFLYCLYKRFFTYLFLFFVLVVFSFMSLGSSSRILFNDSKNNANNLTILYTSGIKNTDYEQVLEHSEKTKAEIIAINEVKSFATSDTSCMIFSKMEPLQEGLVRLSAKYNAYFTLVNYDEKELMFIDIDFSGITISELKGVFHNLAEFVKLQTLPVIVFGNFGVAAWNGTFVEFLASTDLEVKNRIIMTDGKIRFNPFVVPTINVVGYKNLGLEKITFLPKFKSKKHPILFEVSF